MNERMCRGAKPHFSALCHDDDDDDDDVKKKEEEEEEGGKTVYTHILANSQVR